MFLKVTSKRDKNVDLQSIRDRTLYDIKCSHLPTTDKSKADWAQCTLVQYSWIRKFSTSNAVGSEGSRLGLKPSWSG